MGPSAWRPPASGLYYKSIESILQRGLDRQILPEQRTLDLPANHDHLRGPGYFH